MEIIIGTTAINRPELHSDNMGEWYNWINSLDKTKYNINSRNPDPFLHMWLSRGQFFTSL
jgi:hypothetical protein